MSQNEEPAALIAINERLIKLRDGHLNEALKEIKDLKAFLEQNRNILLEQNKSPLDQSKVEYRCTNTAYIVRSMFLRQIGTSLNEAIETIDFLDIEKSQ